MTPPDKTTCKFRLPHLSQVSKDPLPTPHRQTEQFQYSHESRLQEYVEENYGSWLEKQIEFPQVPDTFRSLGSPWRVSDEVSQSETINKVLQRSFEVQASRFAASTDYYKDVSSHIPKDYVYTSTNNCNEISGLLQYYFSRLGIDAKVFCGSIQPSPFPFLHTFLEIDGEIIDNTYVYNILRPEVRLHK